MNKKIKQIISILSFIFFIIIGILLVVYKNENVIDLYANGINKLIGVSNEIDTNFNLDNELVIPVIEENNNNLVDDINNNATTKNYSYAKDLFQHFLNPLTLNTDISISYPYKSLKNNELSEDLIDNNNVLPIDNEMIELLGPDVDISNDNSSQISNTIKHYQIDSGKWTRVEDHFVEAPDGYFDDALFLGDSRTEGLRIYAPIENATYFSIQSLSVFNIEKTVVHINGEGNFTFFDFLNTRKFKKVYIMLGINGVGTSIDNHLINYASIIYKIREINPDCLVYLLANIHVGKDKNKSEYAYNNNKLNELNSAISSIADNVSIFYIDENILFDDENGELNKNYTGDGIHIYPKCYSWFRELLYRNVIIK